MKKKLVNVWKITKTFFTFANNLLIKTIDTIMLVKIKLKNSSRQATVDEHVYKFLTEDPYLKDNNFIQNLREHSSGYAFFQKAWPLGNGKYNTETIYLHRKIAEKFITQPTNIEGKLIVRPINGDRLDCTIENLEWSNFSKAARQSKIHNKTGYRGVRKEGTKFRAVIYYNKKQIHIGMFDSAEEAALAYNEKSKEYFGEDGKINVIKK